MRQSWIVAVLVFAGCAADVTSESAELEVVLCVDTVDCGGICGTRQQVNSFLAQCDARHGGRGPVGPCFSDCWSACRMRAEHSRRPVACTMACMTSHCPDEAASSGLVHAGHAECPAPDPDAICLAVYAPVDCGGCVYSNSCVAASAGFAEGECTDLSAPEEVTF